MENSNVFLWVKAAIAAAVGAFGAAFGWLGWLALAWVGCMALDYLTGSAAAAAKGSWSSAAARAGIWHKGGMIVVVLVAAVTDCVLGMAVLVALGLTAEHWPPLALATGSSVVLVAIAVWEARNRARCLPTSATGH